MARFTGKVALVTGAASGMGLAAAREFAALGAAVALADVSEELGEAAARAIEAEGGKAFFRRSDVRSMDDMKAIVDELMSRYGRLDFAANMAGVTLAGGMGVSIEERDRVVAINLTGTFNSVAAEVPVMIASGGGCIVNCSSVGGLRGSAYAPYYSAAKHGVIGFTKSIAIEYGPENIRSNVICPGLTRTPMAEGFYQQTLEQQAMHVPLGRVSEALDQARAVIWLCSEESSYITGVALPVDGGMVAGSPRTLKPA